MDHLRSGLDQVLLKFQCAVQIHSSYLPSAPFGDIVVQKKCDRMQMSFKGHVVIFVASEGSVWGDLVGNRINVVALRW